MELLTSLAYGLIGGAVISGFGYLRNMTKENFDPQQALTTIVVGGLVGVTLTMFTDIDLSQYDVTAYSATVTYAIQKSIKLIEETKKAVKESSKNKK
jgi:hypothetical protein